LAKTLIVGPAICEFGWMLMTYNPYARAVAQNYERVVVCCPPDERYIWEFATEFHDVKKQDRADRWLIKNGRQIKVPKIVTAKHPNADVIVPSRKTCGSATVRKFRILGEPNQTLASGGIVIHARSTSKYGQSDRNWNPKKFKKVVESVGLKNCFSIGVQADHIPGTVDYRGKKLSMVCDRIRNAKVVIGPSSGPMHLASLCGTPHVVWTYKKKEKAIGGTNRQRYEKIWNPFGTRVEVIDDYGWQPPVGVVVERIKKILKSS